MKLRSIYLQLLREASSGEIFKPTRGKPIKFNPRKHPEIAPEIFDLIQTAYSEIGGFLKIKSPSDILNNSDWTYWEGIDIHNDPDFDIVVFGKKTQYGLKFAGVGHDGSYEAKRSYLQSNSDLLKKPGFYIEVSGKLADVLIGKYNVPVVDDQDQVEKVLGKSVEWQGEKLGSPVTGWYIRDIAGHPHSKILVGRPKVK